MSANKKRNDNILRPSGYIEYYLASLSESKKSNLRQKRLSAILKEFHCPPKIFFYLDKDAALFVAESHHFVQG